MCPWYSTREHGKWIYVSYTLVASSLAHALTRSRTHRPVCVFIKHQTVPRPSSPKIFGSSNVNWGPPGRWILLCCCSETAFLPPGLHLDWTMFLGLVFFQSFAEVNFAAKNISTISTWAWGMAEGLMLDCYYSYLAVSPSMFPHLASVFWLNRYRRMWLASRISYRGLPLQFDQRFTL